MTETRSTSQRVAMGVGWIVAWRMVTRNLGLVSTLVLVRLLAPADFGLVALAASLIATIDQMSTLAVADALIRTRDPSRTMYDTAFTIGLLRGLATAAIIVAAAWPLGRFFDDPRVAVVMVALALGTILTSLENVGIVDFRRQLAFDKEFVLNAVPRLVSVTVTIAAAVLLRSYWALVIGVITNRLVRLPMTYVMSPFRPRLTLRAWRDLIGFSLWTWAQTMQFLVRDRSDAFVIGRIMTTKDYGLFSVGMEVSRLPSSELVEPVARALFSGFATQQHDPAALARMYHNAVSVTFMLVWPAALGISLVADLVVRLMLGDQWLPTVDIVRILALSGVATVFVYPAGALLNALGRPRLAFYLFGSTTLVKVVLLIALVGPMGLLGGAIAIAAIDVLDAIVLSGAVIFCLGGGGVMLLRALVRPILASVAMLAVMVSLGMAWAPSAADGFAALLADAALRCGTGATSYVAALLLLWLLAGRPDGAERFALAALGRLAGRAAGWLLRAK